MAIEINYWEDPKDGSINEVSMDLEGFLELVECGIKGDKEEFEAIKQGCIDIVKRFREKRLSMFRSEEVES